MLQRLLFKLSKAPFMGKMVGTVFRCCSWAVPVKKIYNSKEIIAFYHPRPSYENHIIISPKRAVRDLQQLASESYSIYCVKLWKAVKEIVELHPEYKDSFALVANGGKRQEVGQVHFHMFTNHEAVNEYSYASLAESVFYRDSDVNILEHPNPNWEKHFVILPDLLFEIENRYFRNILHSIDLLDAEFHIVQKGYSFVYQYDKQKSDAEWPVFHIVSGIKLK